MRTSIINAIVPLVIAGLASLGCDVSEPDDLDERNAVVVLELDGEVIEIADVSEAPGVQYDMVELSAQSEARACEADQSELELVLELDGEPAASYQACTAGPSELDELAAGSGTQAVPLSCEICAESGYCFPCCRCYGGTVKQCAFECS